ncbi:histidine phosphatase family protein [Bacillus sp. FJAT-27251]|uniref:histidine phosphatase family protein n=1 Tax=Bacillus sp. FJAT-27251 TaxID=1684142 RepID=UPI0006A771BF|nr:histidine phosphatase family protein [Bacillus sp. FJAT-27251]
MDDTVVIALFRHGLTEGNKRHAYLGWTDSPLCPVAKRKLGKSDARYSMLFSSNLGRCLETSSLLFPQLHPQLMSELREMHFGEWEGKVFEELKEDPHYQKWLSEPFSAKVPGGESFSDFALRVETGWNEITREMGEKEIARAAVMTHGGVIRYLLSKFSPEKKDYWDWKIDHGAGYELVWEEDKWRRGERCTLLQAAPIMEKQNGSGSITG